MATPGARREQVLARLDQDLREILERLDRSISELRAVRQALEDGRQADDAD